MHGASEYDIALPAPTPPVQIIFDASSDQRRAAYVALLRDGASKPRLIYGTAYGVPGTTVELWAANRIIKRANRRYLGKRRLIVFTDHLGMTQARGNPQVSYQWVPRTNRLMRHLHRACNALRKATPLDLPVL